MGVNDPRRRRNPITNNIGDPNAAYRKGAREKPNTSSARARRTNAYSSRFIDDPHSSRIRSDKTSSHVNSNYSARSYGSRKSFDRSADDRLHTRSHSTTGATSSHGSTHARRSASSNAVSLKGLPWLWSKSKAVTIVLCVIVAALIFCGLDAILTSGKIYKGVSVGEVDVSNMTVQEAAQAISDHYIPRLQATTVYIFADKEAADNAHFDPSTMHVDTTSDQGFFEQAQEEKELWIASANNMSASLPSEELANQAFQCGRDEGFFGRLATSISGFNIAIHATFDTTALSDLINDINTSLGSEMKDFDIDIEDGWATVIEGHDGYMLDNEQFTEMLSDSLLHNSDPITGFIAEIHYIPMRIDEANAKSTCNAVNMLIPQSVSFKSNDKKTIVARNDLMEWIRTSPEPRETNSNETSSENDYFLNPFVDRTISSSSLISLMENDTDTNKVGYDFAFDGGEVSVIPREAISVPVTADAISTLDEELFGSYRSTLESSGPVDLSEINIEFIHSSDPLDLKSAISFGLVDVISTFTTKYANTNSTQSRIFNVHHAADLLNNSTVGAGNVWSFNETAGSCDEEHGFKAANVIEAGEYTTGIGGGICQVATTVFNAAYEAGLTIKERHNHSLYSKNYPDGRDAAIAYPYTDLKWLNDTDSEILIKTRYTDDTITVLLIGSDPKREVNTESVGFKEGKKHGVKFEIDTEMAADTSYVKTAGSDGRKISVIRKVKDKDGNVIITDNFESIYAPIMEIVVCGEGSDMNAMREKYEVKEVEDEQ